MADDDSSKMMFMLWVVFHLSFACLSLAAVSSTYVDVVMADSISTRRDLDTAGAGVAPSPSTTPLCLHKVSMQAYDGVVPLKDGSGRLLCWNRNGKIWLSAPLLDVDTNTTGPVVLRVGDKPLIDLGSRVSQDAAARGRGLAGVAVHSSGSLFVSYYTTAAPDDGSAFLIVDQLSSSSASWSGGNDELTTTTRVFSMALPELRRSSSGVHVDYYGGQILFRPSITDPFLYLVTGPAQRGGQLQAKILRFRVPSGGNSTMTPQVYAASLGIPRRCAFDADRPQDLYCAIVKGEQELVYLISEPDATPSYSATPPSPLLLAAHQRPTPGTPPSLVGGLLYRGYADINLTGSYIYMDGSEFWATVARNHSATRNLRVTCSASAASPCDGGGDFAGGGVNSFGEDADKNALLLATDGVYLVVGPSLCDADTQAPTSYKKLIKWIFGVIGTLITTLTSAHVVYKKCSCFNKKSDIHINAPNGNVNIINGNNGIRLTDASGESRGKKQEEIILQ